MWPAKTFRTDFDEAALAQVSTGGTLGVSGGGAAIADLSEQDFETLLKEFESFVGPSGAATVAAARTAAKGPWDCGTRTYSNLIVIRDAGAVAKF